MERLAKMVLEMRKNRVFFLFSSLPYYFLSCCKRTFKCVPKYNGLSLSRLPSISNISLSRTKCSVPWNLPQEYCIAFLYSELVYLELFPISNKFSGPLNHFLSLSRTFAYSNLIFELPNKFEFESKRKFRP